MSRSTYYEVAEPASRVERGDIAVLYLPQARAQGEEDPPLSVVSNHVNVPAYTSAIALTDQQRMPGAEARVWPSLAVVVMDSCELDRHYDLGRSRKNWDSRVAAAPVVFEKHYPNAPWSQMEQGNVPLYGFFMPPLSANVDGKTSWPRALVDLRGTTLVSRHMVELNRGMRLGAEGREALGRRILEFWYLREVARQSQLEARRGKAIREVVPVSLEPGITELRLVFEDAEPLLVFAVPDPV